MPTIVLVIDRRARGKGECFVVGGVCVCVCNSVPVIDGNEKPEEKVTSPDTCRE